MPRKKDKSGSAGWAKAPAPVESIKKTASKASERRAAEARLKKQIELAEHRLKAVEKDPHLVWKDKKFTNNIEDHRVPQAVCWKQLSWWTRFKRKVLNRRNSTVDFASDSPATIAIERYSLELRDLWRLKTCFEIIDVDGSGGVDKQVQWVLL
jgi:hypothetical protein